MRDVGPSGTALPVRTFPTHTDDDTHIAPSQRQHSYHGEAMGTAYCRLKRRVVWLTVTMAAFLFFTLYTLTFTCCVVVHSGQDANHLREGGVVPFREGTPDEARYQRDLDGYSAPQYGMPHQKKLLDHQGHEQKDGTRVVYGDDGAVRYDGGTYPVRTTDDEDVEEIYDLDEDGDIADSPETELRHPKNIKINKSNLIRTREGATKKLPKAIIIGVKKGGTRALLEFIRIHPDVRAPGPEPHFYDRHFKRGLEWYRNQMPATLEGQITMEKTPSYFVTKGVPGRIFNMSKDIKLIVVVRDPVVRAISDYTQTVSKRPDLKPFDQMAFVNDSAGLVDHSWGAIRIGVYAKHLEKWLKYFPLSQIHFVNGEKLISNPAGEMSKVQDFLGLKRVITDKHFFFNTTKGFPCLKKPEGSGSPHCLGKTKGRAHPIVDPKVITRLRDFYRPFNAKFYQMTGIDFGWP